MRAQDRTELKPYELARLGPKPLDRPDTNEAIRLCVNAWHQLDSEREQGMGGPGLIRYTALVAWAEVYHLDRASLELLWQVIHYLDRERVARLESERKLKKGKR